MPFPVAYYFTVRVPWKGESPERDSLIKLDMVANLARLANHDPGAVVDEKACADFRSGMNVDPGF